MRPKKQTLCAYDAFLDDHAQRRGATNQWSLLHFLLEYARILSNAVITTNFKTESNHHSHDCVSQT